MSENSELFKKLDPGTQFQWERISSAVQPRRSLRGSEAEPTTNSQYSCFQGRERSLDPRRLGRAFRHSRTNSAFAQDLRRPSALGLTGGEEKSDSPFVFKLSPPSRTGPGMQVFQQASGSPDQAYPDPRCGVRWIQTCLRTIGLAPPQSNLERDCCSANRRALGQRKYSQSVKDQREDVRGARLRPGPLRTTSLKARFPPEHSP